MEHANQYLPSHKTSSSCVKTNTVVTVQDTTHYLCTINILVQFHLAFLTAKRNCLVKSQLHPMELYVLRFLKETICRPTRCLHHLILFSDLLITLRTRCPRDTHWIYVVYGTCGGSKASYLITSTSHIRLAISGLIPETSLFRIHLESAVIVPMSLLFRHHNDCSP
jgi:hypothetical protein